MTLNKDSLSYIANYQFILVVDFNNLIQQSFCLHRSALPIMTSSWGMQISCMNPAGSVWWTICARTHRNYTPSVVSSWLRSPALSSLHYLTIFFPCGLCTLAFIPHWQHISNFQSILLFSWNKLICAFNLCN